MNPDDDDPYRIIRTTGFIAGGMFALAYWAIVIVTLLTSGFTLGGLLIAVLVSVAAWIGFLGWRRRKVAFSGAGLVLLFSALALSRYV